MYAGSPQRGRDNRGNHHIGIHAFSLVLKPLHRCNTDFATMAVFGGVCGFFASTQCEKFSFHNKNCVQRSIFFHIVMLQCLFQAASNESVKHVSVTCFCYLFQTANLMQSTFSFQKSETCMNYLEFECFARKLCNMNKTHILNADAKDIKFDDNTFVYITSF